MFQGWGSISNTEKFLIALIFSLSVEMFAWHMYESVFLHVAFSLFGALMLWMESVPRAIQCMLGATAALFLRGHSVYSSYAMGQDWKADNLISQGDANDSLCNFIFFHLASSSQAAIHQFHVFTYCIVFNVSVPERGFHRQNKYTLIARMAAE